MFPSNTEGRPMLDPDGGLLRGTLDVLILKALSWGPRHGYAVAEWIKMISDEDLLVEEGPLYTALHRLERKGWLTAEWGYSENNRKAKYYTLSPGGRRQLRVEVSSWERYVRAVTKALVAAEPIRA
jgi:PadR family transcriptional regulator